MNPTKDDILKLIDEFKETIHKRLYINEMLSKESNSTLRDLTIRQFELIHEYEGILKERMKMWGVL